MPRRHPPPVIRRHFAGKAGIESDGQVDQDESKYISDGDDSKNVQPKIEINLNSIRTEEYNTHHDEKADTAGGQHIHQDYISKEEQQEQSSEEEEEESESDESSSDDETNNLLAIAPKFIRSKSKATSTNSSSAIGTAGAPANDASSSSTTSEPAVAPPSKTKQSTLERFETAILADSLAKRSRLTSEDAMIAQVDDTDGLDPEGERDAWKAREKARMDRELQEMEEEELELEEIEKRRNMSEKEKDQEAEELTRLRKKEEEKQKEDADGKQQTKYLQRYYHKGGFYQDQEILKRDFSEALEDDYRDKSVLPKALQVRGNLGLKGRTKFKSLREEDTTYVSKRRKN